MIRISWDDVGRASRPGVYTCRGLRVTIRQSEIEDWRRHPTAVFNAVKSSTLAGSDEYGLTTFEVPNSR